MLISKIKSVGYITRRKSDGIGGAGGIELFIYAIQALTPSDGETVDRNSVFAQPCPLTQRHLFNVTRRRDRFLYRTSTETPTVWYNVYSEFLLFFGPVILLWTKFDFICIQMQALWLNSLTAQQSALYMLSMYYRSSEVVYFGTNRKRICDFLLVLNGNLVPIVPRFTDITLELLYTVSHISRTRSLFRWKFRGDPLE